MARLPCERPVLAGKAKGEELMDHSREMWATLLEKARADPDWATMVCPVQAYSCAKIMENCGFPEAMRELERTVERYRLREKPKARN